MPKFFDIHSHINFNAFKNDGDEVIKRTLSENVWTILIGSQHDTSKRAIEYAEKYNEGIYSAVGLHPFHLIEQEIKANDWEIDAQTSTTTEVKPIFFKTRVEKFDPVRYLQLITSNKSNFYETRKKEISNGVDEEKYSELAKSKKVVAIGECGLDYYHIPRNNDLTEKEIKNLQIETFEKQIELALKLNLPIMVHCREAHNEIIEILQKYKPRAGDKLRGDIHFFTGDYAQAKQYFDLDFKISFTGVITFTHDYNETIKKSPLENIMIETDAPYVAPIPYRGKRNEPIYVKEVARRVAEIKNLDLETVAETTTQNAIKLFLK